jgi:hypothetical protein
VKDNGNFRRFTDKFREPGLQEEKRRIPLDQPA